MPTNNASIVANLPPFDEPVPPPKKFDPVS